MCGIAGIFMRNGEGIPDPCLIRRMTDTLRHRGPDEEGFYQDGPVALGHRRLSIIDLGTGRQPIFNEDRSMAIVFNGEIYNYQELQNLLEEKGHRFRTRSDTEAILHAYEEWGEESPSRLRGMFAYAIWDGNRQEIFLARDRIGKKPLYYMETPGSFVFASELKSILQFPGVEREIDLEALSDYLSFLYVPSPKSIFKGIRKLPSAHCLTVSRTRRVFREYWDISFREEQGRREDDWVEELSERIREAVQVRLKSEVPLGAFLSGGLDSSVVVGYMAGLLPHPVETMSIGFAEEEFNEFPYASEVSSLFGTLHHEFRVDTEAASMIDQLAWFYDEPFADSSAVPTFHVSRIARSRVTVALSGDGGDENFAGYRRYYFDRLENRIRQAVPGFGRRLFFGAISRAYPKADWLPQVLRAKSMFQSLSLTPEEGYFRTMSAFLPEMKAAVLQKDILRQLGGYDSFSVLEPHFRRAGPLDPLLRVQYVDMKTYLPDDILVKVDRASMANSLEVRAPLLDHHLMEFAASIPGTLKLRGRTGKYVLKRAAARILPDALVYRKKMGFSIPIDHWLRTSLKPMATDLLLSPGARITRYLDSACIRRMWDQHQKSWKNYGTHLWLLLTLEAWHRKHAG
jgi:asparagine synthase (glutamine-hydrolysing)